MEGKSATAKPQIYPQFSKDYARHLYVSAVEFYQTYQAVATAPSLDYYLGVDHKFIGMRHFALCHALELTFKSLLVDTGTYNEQMLMDKRLGHDLVALANEVKQVYGSFPEVDACMDWIQILNPDYKGKGYEYPINNGSFAGTDAAQFSETVDALLRVCISRVESHTYPDCLLPPPIIKKTKSLQTV